MIRIISLIVGVLFFGQLIYPISVEAGSDIERVKRYDDAKDWLPKATKKNTTNVRLILPQMSTETNYEVISPRNVALAIFANIPSDAKAAVVLLPGSTGVLSLAKDGKLGPSFNIFSRSRDYFFQNGIATFLVDASSDHLDKTGWTQSHRKHEKHATDLAAVLKSIKSRFDGPIFVAGHSDGSISAVSSYANDKAGNVSGIILSASVTQKGRGHVSSFDLEKTTVPVLAIHHAKDKCKFSPPKNAAKLKSTLKATKFNYVAIDGGAPKIWGHCGPFSAHSFFGVEKKYADEISKWILNNN